MKLLRLFVAVCLAMFLAPACGEESSGTASNGMSGAPGEGGAETSGQGEGGSRNISHGGSGDALGGDGAGALGGGGPTGGSVNAGGAGSAEATFGECLAEGDGFATCEEYCGSEGKHCVAGGCGEDGATFLGWASFARAGCDANTGSQSIGNQNFACDESLLWGPSATYVRCCCAPGPKPPEPDMACAALPDTVGAGGAGGMGSRDTTSGGAPAHFSECNAKKTQCKNCNEVCAEEGQTCVYQGCSAINFYGVEESGLTHVSWIAGQQEMCTSFDVPVTFAAIFQCDGSFFPEEEYVRCCCSGD